MLRRMQKSRLGARDASNLTETFRAAIWPTLIWARCAQDNKWKDTLDRWADDMSCALFGLANVVTIMYYIVDTTTGVSPGLPHAADVV